MAGRFFLSITEGLCYNNRDNRNSENINMEEKAIAIKIEIVCDYIKRLEKAIETFEPALENNDELVDLNIEIANIFDEEIPQIKNTILLRHGTEIRDANTTIGLLKLYLANHGIRYEQEEDEKNIRIKHFWSAFILWFENELPNLELLQNKYVQWDNWDGGTWFLNLNYDYEFRKYRGVDYPESLKNNTGDFEDIKTFLEIAYKYWIINEGKAHYDFTVEVNERFKIFRLPYRMQNGRILRQGYKTTYGIDKIINYRMFERKIGFSEDMINSDDLMEKKSALDFIIDALRYLVSIQEGNRDKQYAALAKSVNEDNNSKVYAVIKQEVNDLMKISNEYFDIRHNDYLNAAKEKREALSDSQFIEYLYNRAYSLLYLLRLKINKIQYTILDEK